MTKCKRAELAIIFGLLFSLFLNLADFDASCDGLRNNILRLHIIANSDDPADQELKLKVRDAILKETSSVFGKCDTVDDAVSAAMLNIERITEIANKTAAENGYGYNCSVSVKKEHYGTRVYDDFTLPAGEYNSLIVKIGKAKGHNWWCVVFPGVCLSAADREDSLTKSVDKSSSKIAYNAENYVIKFKTVEIYEKIRQKIVKN